MLLCSLFFAGQAQSDTTFTKASDSTESQSDSLITVQDSSVLIDPSAVVNDSPEKEEKLKNAPVDTAARGYQNPGKAALYSAVFPGLGQIYNKKYWKLPIVYGALAGGIYAITFNHDQYRIYLDGFYSRIDEEPNNDQFVGQYDERQLIELQNIYRRWRDLSIILTGVAYGLQILDAYVDAHLFYFDVSEDLSLNWQPSVIRNQHSPSSAFGVGLTLSFR